MNVTLNRSAFVWTAAAVGIDARTGYQAGKFLYDDGWDQCEHAGTLKIRAVPQKPVPLVFDWYGLKPLATTLTLSAPPQGTKRDCTS